MKISVILAHPSERSFNHAIAETIVEQLESNGHDVMYHDLYKEDFDPILNAAEIPNDADLPSTISEHCGEISIVDGIVIVHPNWWGQPPAILKGWVDRVIRPGVAYEFLDGDSGEGVPNGLLQASTGLVFNTSNTELQREKTVFGDPLELIWKNCIFDLCGVHTFYRRMFNIVIASTESQRMKWLEETRQITNSYFPK